MKTTKIKLCISSFLCKCCVVSIFAKFYKKILGTFFDLTSMMKLLLVFASCAISCCLAVPNSEWPPCSPVQLQFCPKGPVFDRITTEDDLDQVCRAIECWVDLSDTCGDDYMGPIGYFSINGYRKMVNALCDKTNPLRRKFLENAVCIAEEMTANRDVLKNCGLKGFTREEYCRNISEGIRCAVDYITRKCGQEAGDVFQVSSPGLDPYDCLP